MSVVRVFNGDRLKAARIYRGKTIAELADEVQVSKQSISQYENGKANPSLETLLKLISALGFPRDYFYEKDDKSIKVGTTYFRALLSTNKKDRLSQEEKTKILAKIYHTLNQFVQFPKINIPPIREGINDIEKVAQATRDYWKLGTDPIPNMVYILEKNGFIVTSFGTDNANIDAFSQRQEVDGEEYLFIVLGSDKSSAARRQFDAAHELGHIMLHDWNADLELVSREEFRQMENEAHQFAASFLLPKEAFLKDLVLPNNLDFYIELKKKWKVSISAMIVRAYQLKAINYNQYQYLMRQISKKGWRTKEPLDDVIQVSKPTVLRKAVDVIQSNGVLSGDQFMHQLSKNNVSMIKDEVEILLGLDRGTLSEVKQNAVVLSLRHKDVRT
ncbi:ImmA/IrrE family metallo-endopeptidase [Paenibacillus chitinolyticus]|uniref:ImmA/IrrE family metallo-endopeptidase n=1 Tax=Paenibacillus chitinolyticus TaxID=79263 RepID=A0A410WQ69_9BACL|nr:XRE family transcriptional regulator [Paenibacillus chitinolyticus]MCY9591054.1 XRE family transcriptional regulator [Paenibacillus chitinolyticus]MCY9597145.1 XRE family transcriptional regulator [Paenibacillus chitinolyticus]QAV16484.1 ImmA/IrrE family metallo-endopeptidase [Paenibacillus chitinolyticus]